MREGEVEALNTMIPHLLDQAHHPTLPCFAVSDSCIAASPPAAPRRRHQVG